MDTNDKIEFVEERICKKCGGKVIVQDAIDKKASKMKYVGRCLKCKSWFDAC